MKTWMLSGILPILVAFTWPLNESEAQSFEPCEMKNYTFEVGEQLTYKVYYNWNFVWLSAGEVTFQVHDEGDEYHVSARGSTYSSYEWFYKVRDNYDSYIDKETLLPRVHIKDVHEGNYMRYDKTTFNQAARRATSIRGKTRTETTREIYDLAGCSHDILSIMYFMRNLNPARMRVGEEIPINIFLDREQYDLSVKYLGKEERTKVKGMGRYNTLKFSPQVIAGEVFKEGDEMTVWVTDDQNKIPVLIESPVSVGSVKVVLKDYSGLKYDFTAKVD